jgi:2-polyprenyl-3-methyl-5-hydroxy-6-metoxy-1,4-benzoquinol methylase
VLYLSFMDAGLDYIKANKELWNKRTGFHVLSEFYNVEAFIKGESSLNAIELDLLGNVKGKKILHLQCHFGQDSLSLARMGAKVTGVDLSDKAIEKAKELSVQLDLDARFICSDLYELPTILDEQFDLVFTSYGTIGWLPDLDKWGAVVSRF